MATRTRPHLILSAAPIAWAEPPETATSPGTPGTVAYDAGYLYLCIAEDLWVRIPVESW